MTLTVNQFVRIFAGAFTRRPADLSPRRPGS